MYRISAVFPDLFVDRCILRIRRWNSKSDNRPESSHDWFLAMVLSPREKTGVLAKKGAFWRVLGFFATTLVIEHQSPSVD
jgi:hypothetical protein